MQNFGYFYQKSAHIRTGSTFRARTPGQLKANPAGIKVIFSEQGYNHFLLPPAENIEFLRPGHT